MSKCCIWDITACPLVDSQVYLLNTHILDRPGDSLRRGAAQTGWPPAFLYVSHTCLFQFLSMFCLWLLLFQLQSCVTATETIGPQKPNTLMVWPFWEKYAGSWPLS